MANVATGNGNESLDHICLRQWLIIKILMGQGRGGRKKLGTISARENCEYLDNVCGR